MKIRMLRNQYGSPNGVTLLLYEDGKEYVLDDAGRPADLAAVFLREGWAVEVKPKPVVEAKSEPAAPEDKAIGAAPENKGEPQSAFKRRKG